MEIRAIPWLVTKALSIATVLLPVAGHAQTPPVDQAPAPLQVGLGVPIRSSQGAPAQRQPWCDFGNQAKVFLATPPSADPVFRTPTELVKAKLGVVRKTLMLGKLEPAAAVIQLRALFGLSEGASLARLAVMDPDPKMAAAALDAAQSIAPQHPRLFALAAEKFAHPDPAVAEAAVRLAFSTGCDIPALYALDGLRHPDARVQRATVALVRDAARWRTDIGLVVKLTDWLESGEGAPQARLAAIRALGELAWLPATGVLNRLVRTGKLNEAAEAFVALSAVSPSAVAGQVEAWLRDKAAVKRAAGARAVAQALALDQRKVEKWLAMLLADPATGADPLAPTTTVGQVAKQALAYVRMEPTAQR